MAQELVLIFDDLGNMYEVENITEMLTVIDDLELLPIYKSTVYEHKLTMAMEELVAKGYYEPTDKPYNPEAGERGIKYLTTEIIKRFGEDNNNKILAEIDSTWDKNKPEIPDKPKKTQEEIMEMIQHLLGACGDNHSHFDLTDLAFMGGGAMGVYSLKYYIIGTYLVAKNYISEKFKNINIWK